MTQPHIPGPWRIEKTDDDLTVWSENGTEICQVIAIPIDDEYAEEETEANALLIAAAPELLEALTGLCEQIASLHDESSVINDDLEQGPWIAKAKSAIAMATRG